jgi:23S rRNA (guanosine2251-2'-O)-methyltransferase
MVSAPAQVNTKSGAALRGGARRATCRGTTAQGSEDGVSKRQGQGGRDAGKGAGRRERPPAGGWDPREADRPGHRPRQEPSRQGSSRQEAPRHEAAPRPARTGEPLRRTGLPVLYGFHAVAEALRNPSRVVHRVLATANAAAKLAELAPESRVPTTTVMGPDLDRLVGQDAVHQGVVAEVDNLPALDLHDLPDTGIVLVLDQVTDPHNVGAILRSAAAFGVSGVVMTDRHSPDATGVLAKTASGGLEHVPLVVVGNLAQALTQLGERGFWRVGLDSEGDMPLEAAIARPPVALVLGAEGKGLRRLTRERCDVLARLDMPGAIKSLNVSNAAAVALYAVGRALGPA